MKRFCSVAVEKTIKNKSGIGETGPRTGIREPVLRLEMGRSQWLT